MNHSSNTTTRKPKRVYDHIAIVEFTISAFLYMHSSAHPQMKFLESSIRNEKQFTNKPGSTGEIRDSLLIDIYLGRCT